MNLGSCSAWSRCRNRRATPYLRRLLEELVEAELVEEVGALLPPRPRASRIAPRAASTDTLKRLDEAWSAADTLDYKALMEAAPNGLPGVPARNSWRLPSGVSISSALDALDETIDDMRDVGERAASDPSTELRGLMETRLGDQPTGFTLVRRSGRWCQVRSTCRRA